MKIIKAIIDIEPVADNGTPVYDQLAKEKPEVVEILERVEKLEKEEANGKAE